jgi:hypothetical protein
MASFLSGLFGTTPNTNTNPNPNPNNVNPSVSNSVTKRKNMNNPNQTGGVAPVNARDPMLQPSESVMQRATTAELRGGGRRKKTHRRKARKARKTRSKKYNKRR